MMRKRGSGALPLLILVALGCSRGELPERAGQEEEDELHATTEYYANIALQQGNQYLARGDCERAMRSYARAIDYNPRLAQAHCNLGYIHYIKGNYEEAMDKFFKTVTIDSRYAGAYFYLGKLYDKRGMVDEAIEQYGKAVEILPEYAAAHFFLGKGYEKKGLVDKALRAYRNYLKHAPDGDGVKKCQEAIERLKQ